MENHLIEWLGLLLRWLHVITGIAWIGNSFYFMWLDSHLERPRPTKPDVEGELWMVHSGGFYLVERKIMAPGGVPQKLPKTLHWFKWEAAMTWLSGFFLLGVVYYVGGGTRLGGASSGLSPQGAMAIGILSLPLSWLVYDTLWSSRLALAMPRSLALACGCALVGIGFGFIALFEPRAAFIHVGAVLGTLMAANVWIRILPAQAAMIRATEEGRAPDLSLSKKAKTRSIHNNYMTLPLIFIMLSNHYPMVYGHEWSGVLLAFMLFGGGATRHFFNLKNQKKIWKPAPLALGASLIAAALILSTPQQKTMELGNATLVHFFEARAIIERRCLSCHSAAPSDPTFGPLPGGVSFETSEKIRAMGDRIKFRVVTTQTMPFANKTGITDEERTMLGAWIDGGMAD